MDITQEFIRVFCEIAKPVFRGVELFVKGGYQVEMFPSGYVVFYELR